MTNGPASQTIDNPRCQSPPLFDTGEADNDTGEALVASWRTLTAGSSVRLQARRSQLIFLTYIEDQHNSRATLRSRDPLLGYMIMTLKYPLWFMLF